MKTQRLYVSTKIYRAATEPILSLLVIFVSRIQFFFISFTPTFFNWNHCEQTCFCGISQFVGIRNEWKKRKRNKKTNFRHVHLIRLKQKHLLRLCDILSVTMNHDCIQLNFATFYFMAIFHCYFSLYLSVSILLCPIEKKNTFDFRCDKRKRERNKTIEKKVNYAYIGETNYPIGKLLALFYFSLCALRMSTLCPSESNEPDFSGD